MQAYAFTRIAVDSRSIATLGYDPIAGVLEVAFRRGPVYRYLHVPWMLLAAFLAAPSKGAFFNTYVRDRFPHQREWTGLTTNRE